MTFILLLSLIGNTSWQISIRIILKIDLKSKIIESWE